MTAGLAIQATKGLDDLPIGLWAVSLYWPDTQPVPYSSRPY